MIPHEYEDFNLIGLDVEQVVVDKTGNIILSTEDDVNIYDAKTFSPSAHLGSI